MKTNSGISADLDKFVLQYEKNLHLNDEKGESNLDTEIKSCIYK